MGTSKARLCSRSGETEPFVGLWVRACLPASPAWGAGRRAQPPRKVLPTRRSTRGAGERRVARRHAHAGSFTERLHPRTYHHYMPRAVLVRRASRAPVGRGPRGERGGRAAVGVPLPRRRGSRSGRRPRHPHPPGAGRAGCAVAGCVRAVIDGQVGASPRPRNSSWPAASAAAACVLFFPFSCSTRSSVAGGPPGDLV